MIDNNLKCDITDATLDPPKRHDFRITQALGNPTGLTFVLKKGGTVEVRSWNKTEDRQSTTKET